MAATELLILFHVNFACDSSALRVHPRRSLKYFHSIPTLHYSKTHGLATE
jgi:hypothetical protein